MSDLVGWLATTIFAISYFVRNPVTMRWVQAAAALCWMTYGILLHAAPVIVANIIVAGAGCVLFVPAGCASRNHAAIKDRACPRLASKVRTRTWGTVDSAVLDDGAYWVGECSDPTLKLSVGSERLLCP